MDGEQARNSDHGDTFIVKDEGDSRQTAVTPKDTLLNRIQRTLLNRIQRTITHRSIKIPHFTVKIT